MTIQQAEIMEALNVAWLKYKAEKFGGKPNVLEQGFREIFARAFLEGASFGANELQRRTVERAAGRCAGDDSRAAD